MISEELKVGHENETAQEALERYNKVAELRDSEYKVVYTQKISMEEIKEAEKTLGIKLPQQYVDFVTTYGLFKIDSYYGSAWELLHPSKFISVYQALEEGWEFDESMYAEYDIDEAGQQNLKNIYCFSMGDRQLQIVWYCCFDFTRPHPTTGEAQIAHFDQDDWYWMAESPKVEDSMFRSTFDEHVRGLINRELG